MTTLQRVHRTPGIYGIRREIDRLFDDLSNSGNGGERNAVWAPRTDISEGEDAYTIRLDLPGMSKDAVEIELHDDTLTVSGERSSEHESSGERVHRSERTYGRFHRQFTLPQASDPEGVSARMEHGVLTVSVPKREETKPRRIDVA